MWKILFISDDVLNAPDSISSYGGKSLTNENIFQ